MSRPTSRSCTHVLALTLCGLVHAGCGGFAPAGEAHKSEGQWTLHVTGDVAPGEEQNACLTVVLDRDLDINAIHAITGGYSVTHHLILWSNETAGSDGAWDCGDSLPELWMGDALWATGTKDDALTFPAGAAMRIAKGSRLTLNAHFRNTGEDVLHGDASVELGLAPPDVEVEHTVGLWSMQDYAFSIPPESTITTHHTCTAPSAGSILAVVPHMHGGGLEMRFYMGANTEPWAKVSASDEAGHAILSPPELFFPDDRVTVECDIINSTGTRRGPPDEMCNALVYVLDWGGSVACL